MRSRDIWPRPAGSPFGEETVIGYLYAREAEITAVRIIMAGRMAGLDGETIRSRLRATYV